MGKLQQANDVEIGKALLDELRGYGNDMHQIVSRINQLALNYDAFRSGLGDAADQQSADEWLNLAVTAGKQTLDEMNPNAKSWMDSVMAGLGYSRTI